MRRAFSIFAFTGFLISLIVHLTTFFGIDPAKHVPWVWVLHLGIFIAFIPMLLTAINLNSGSQGALPSPRKKDFWSKFLATLPRWVRYTIKAFFAYAIINFAVFFFLSKGGVPDVRDGKYVLHNHGDVIRELTEDEYQLQNAYVLRGFSGHWMIFYLIPALYFWYRKDEPALS